MNPIALFVVVVTAAIGALLAAIGSLGPGIAS